MQGLGFRVAIKRSPVRLLVWAWLRNEYGQFVHTFVPLLPRVSMGQSPLIPSLPNFLANVNVLRYVWYML